MLFFVDETWQDVGATQIGALGAVAIPTKNYNRFCREIYAIKASVLGATEMTDSEFKAQSCLAKAAFKRHALHQDSYWIRATDQLFDALAKYDASLFVIWTMNPQLLNLRNPHSTALSKPYKQFGLPPLSRTLERCGRKTAARRFKCREPGRRIHRSFVVRRSSFIA